MVFIFFLALVLFLRLVRPQYNSVTNFCKLIDHQSILFNGTLFIDGGRQIYTNFDNNGKDIGPHVLGINEDLLTVDMTISWDSKTNLSINGIPKNSSVPYLTRGALYPDPASPDKFFLFGGTDAIDNKTFPGYQQPQPEGTPLWSYNITSDVWSTSNTPSSVLRPCSGASATVEDKGMAFYFNGEQDQGSSLESVIINDTTRFLDGMIVLDLSNQSARNLSTKAVSSQARVRGGIIHIPLTGSDGIMVLLGGGQKPSNNLLHDWKGTLVSFQSVDIFDVGSLQQSKNPDGVWYSQETTGSAPAPRLDACVVAAAAPDNSSYNIYMYGGRDGLNVYYDEVWILTLPSFQWTLAYSGNSPRYSMTCHIAGNRQLITVGGSDTSHIAENCDTASYGLAVFDLTNLSWGSTYDAKAPTYRVPQEVIKLIGGSSSGGATVNTPAGGFSNTNLGSLFRAASPSSSDMQEHTPTASPHSSQGSQGSQQSRKPQGSHARQIAGGVVGAIGGCSILVAAIFLLKQRSPHQRSLVQQNDDFEDKPAGKNPDELDSNQLYEVVGSKGRVYEKSAQKHMAELPGFSSDEDLMKRGPNGTNEPSELDGSSPQPSELQTSTLQSENRQ